MKYEGFERNMWADSYNYFLKFRGISRDDTEGWEDVMLEYERLNKVYCGHPFMRELLLKALDCIENKAGQLLDGKTYEEWENEISKNVKFGDAV